MPLSLSRCPSLHLTHGMVLVALSALPGNAQTLTGTVTGSDGHHIAGAVVTAMGTSKIPWSRAATTTAPDGTFSFNGLSAGSYRLCVDVPAGGYLNPCAWSKNPPSATVAASGPVPAGLQLTVKAGSILTLQLNDPNGLVKPTAVSANAPPPVLIGVNTSIGLFLPAVMRSKTTAGSTHQVTIPFDVPVKVSMQSAQFSLSNSSGTPVSAASNISVTQGSTPGLPPQTLTFQISGLKP